MADQDADVALADRLEILAEDLASEGRHSEAKLVLKSIGFILSLVGGPERLTAWDVDTARCQARIARKAVRIEAGGDAK